MIASLMRTLGLSDLQSALTDLRLKVAWFVAYGFVTAVGVAFLALAAYQGLARVMASELAALALGLALLVSAGVLHRFSKRRRCETRAWAAPALGSAPSEIASVESALLRSDALDPTAEVGRAVAGLLRQSQLGASDLAKASLVAGLVFGSRSFRSR